MCKLNLIPIPNAPTFKCVQICCSRQVIRSMDAVQDHPNFSGILFDVMCARHPRVGRHVPPYHFNQHLLRPSLYLNAFDGKYPNTFNASSGTIAYCPSVSRGTNATLSQALGKRCDLYIWFGGVCCYEARVEVAPHRNVDRSYTLRVLPFEEIDRAPLKLIRLNGQLRPNPAYGDFEHGEIVEARGNRWQYDENSGGFLNINK